MSNDPDSPGSGDEEIWSEVDHAYPDGAVAARRNGFTAHRRRIFLKTLRKTGCALDAARRARISATAAYNLRERDPMFARLWDAALVAAGADLELLAWQYAVEGEEEEVWAYGKRVGVRRKRDARLFRMLLQSSNPHKYGGHGLGTRKQLEKKIRKEMEDERKAAEGVDIDEVRERLARRIERLRERMLREQAEQDETGADAAPEGPSPQPFAGIPFAASGGEGADEGSAPSDATEDPGLTIGSWRSCPRPPDA